MTAEPDALVAVEQASERFYQQWATGEWEGPGQRNWLTTQWPCGSYAPCPCHPNTSDRRGLPPWSQVVAAPGPFDRWYQ